MYVEEEQDDPAVKTAQLLKVRVRRARHVVWSRDVSDVITNAKLFD